MEKLFLTGIVLVLVIIITFLIIDKDNIIIKKDLQTICKGTKIQFDDELFMVECQPVTCYIKKDKLVTCNTK